MIVLRANFVTPACCTYASIIGRREAPDVRAEREWAEEALRGERRKNMRLGIVERLDVTLARVQALHHATRVQPSVRAHQVCGCKVRRWSIGGEWRIILAPYTNAASSHKRAAISGNFETCSILISRPAQLVWVCRPGCVCRIRSSRQLVYNCIILLLCAPIATGDACSAAGCL